MAALMVALKVDYLVGILVLRMALKSAEELVSSLAENVADWRVCLQAEL